MFKDKELILFDFDGTLIDSGPDLSLALNDMLTQLGRDTFTQEIIHTWVGNGAQTLVKRALLGQSDISAAINNTYFENALKIFLASYEKNVCVDTLLYPNVKEMLVGLQRRGFRLAIITNKPYKFIMPILKGLGIENYFELLLGGDSLAVKKPKPEPLLHVCKELCVDISRSLMVGDSKNDILAAQAANIESIGVSYGYNYGEHISKYKPDVVIDDIKKILELV